MTERSYKSLMDTIFKEVVKEMQEEIPNEKILEVMKAIIEVARKVQEILRFSNQSQQCHHLHWSRM